MLTDVNFLIGDKHTIHCDYFFMKFAAKMVPVHAVCALLSLAPVLVLSVPPIWTQPEQVHLSHAGVPGSMVVTWTTFNKTDSEVEYGLIGARLFGMRAKGDATVFVDSGEEKRKMFIHRVILTDLKPAATYVYHCGGDDGWSDIFSFTALNDSSSFSPRFALYGDLGNENPQSLARLQKETQQGLYDVILHIGDFAYDMHEDNARIGDEFMRQIQSIAAYVPYMTCPGNHEAAYREDEDKSQVDRFSVFVTYFIQGRIVWKLDCKGPNGYDAIETGPTAEVASQHSNRMRTIPGWTCAAETEEGLYDFGLPQSDNFSNYRNRFSMPGQTESLWYSWNLGSAHIISFSTEVYFYLQFGLELLFKQYEWLKRDLEVANRPENRAAQPWIITMGHRPMYCSDDDQDDCTIFDSYVRLGRKDTKPPAPGLEDLFYHYGVDVELWAHEHTYERLWPVYGDKVYNGSTEKPYVNPKAPVHIITGSAGCRERTDRFNPNPKAWSARRSTDYGYTRMHVVNATHLYLEQVSDDQDGKVIDNIWVVKEKHGFSAWL